MSPELATLAERRHGVFHHGEALARGETDGSIRRHLESGRWRVVQPRVYAPSGAFLDTCARMWAVRLAVGPRMAFSHRWAALLWQLPGVELPEQVEIVVPRHCRVRGLVGVKVRRTHDDARLGHRLREGLPVVALESAVVQLAAVLRLRAVEDLCQEVLRVRRTTATRLRAKLRRGVSGSALLRRVLAFVTEGESRFERMLLSALLRRGLPRPAVGHPVREASGRRRRLDLFYEPIRFAIEVDGYLPHSLKETFLSDRRRQNRLILEAGIEIARYAADDVRDRPDEVVDEIAAHLRRRGMLTKPA